MDPQVKQFRDIQLQVRKDEVWRFTDFSALLTDSLSLPEKSERQTAEYHCNLPDMGATRLVTENGYCHVPMEKSAEGVITGSLREALERYPELVEPYLGRCAQKSNPYLQWNDTHYTDGVFIYLPDGVEATQPFQLQSVVNAGHGLFLQVRNLVVAGAGSRLTIVHCDDSYDAAPAFANNVTEIFAGEGARIAYYKMQNLNNRTGLLNHLYATVAGGVELRAVGITLNGGHVCNHTEVNMQGEHCNTQVHGLYLSDQEQRVENYVYVDHAQPNCHSRELFKGILDDTAQGRFNGHVLVAPGATKTEAYMANKNILLTDKAFIDTRPFLEIYNDDVKCSHGSTIGQLDEQALFYLRSRGITDRTARTMLLYAFCDEVLQFIDMPVMRDRLSDLVKKRLHGELTLCADCALQCSTPCNGPEVHFSIDPEKL